MSDGMLEPIPEDSLHYCLLLGGGDTNDRGEDGEGSNTPVCRPRGVQKTLMRGPSSGRIELALKLTFSERGEVWLSHLVGGQGIAGSNPAVLTEQSGRGADGSTPALGAGGSRFDSGCPTDER